MIESAEKKDVFVAAFGLTAGELRASKLPDTYLNNVFTEFRSKNKLYTATYNTLQRTKSVGSYIQLNGYYVGEDFEDVKATFVSETFSQLGARAEDSMAIAQIIRLPNTLTQREIADFVELCERNFTDVKITAAYFSNVPMDKYKNSGLPLEKITCE